MRKGILFFLTFLMVFALSACAVIEDIREQSGPPQRNIDVSVFTESELIAIIEELTPEAFQRVEFDLASFQDALEAMVDQVGQSVIGIRTQGNVLAMGGTASGVIYHRDGNHYYVITNEHVVNRASSVEIVYERNGLLFTIPARQTEILGADATTDIAVIRFESDQNFPVAPFADSYQTRVGQFVFAIGNPLGFSYFGTLTMGVVSGTARFVPNSPLEVPFIQHDASISPGNSGGALFNINGEVIGINNMKIVNNVATNIGFAIPSNTALRIARDLIEHGEVVRPFLGVTSNPQESECGQAFGVCVTVQNGGAAQAAGLRNGDVIVGYKLQEWDEFIPILNFNDLREAILNSSVGDEVALEYIRNNERRTTSYVALRVHPDDQ